MAVRKQDKSPGAGWRLLKSVNGVNYWTNAPAPGSKDKDTGHSGGTSGHTSGSSGSSGMTAKEKAKLKAKYLELYKKYIGGSKYKPPKGFIEKAVKGEWGAQFFYMKIRETDKNWLHTKDALAARDAFKIMVQQTLGADGMKDNKKLHAAMLKYMKEDPDKIKTQTKGYFTKYIMRSAAFKKLYPGFNSWFKSKEMLGIIDQSDPISAATLYKQKWDALDEAWKSGDNGIGDPNATIPQELFMAAMKGNWTIGETEWVNAVKSSASWQGTQGAANRRNEFESNWDRVFNGTAFEDMEPDQALMDKYMKGSIDFDTFFKNEFKTGTVVGDMFNEAYPSYQKFIASSPEYLDGTLSLFGPQGYFDKRAAFIDEYKALMEDPDAIPPAADLDLALSGNWSNIQWQLHVKKNVPEYKDTSSFISKEADFRKQWSALFGEDSVVDPTLQDKYINGSFNNIDGLWEDIKKLDIFKEQYPEWEGFSTAQNAKGIPVQEDPALYKQFSQAFDDAFSSEGLDPTEFQPMKPQYFSSGVGDDEFKSNIKQWSTQKAVYKVATGQEADVATAGGIANKAAGGDLRKRLVKSLDKYKALSQSASAAPEARIQRNALTQKI